MLVVSVGLPELPVLADPTGHEWVALPSASPVDVVEAVRQRPRHTHVVVAAPQGLVDGLPEAVNLVRDLVDRRAALWAPTVGGLAVSAALTRLHALDPSAPVALSALKQAVRDALAWTWLRSVSKLENPAPRLVQHLFSAVSSKGFLVSWNEEPLVVRAADAPVDRWAAQPDFAATWGQAPAEVVERFRAAAGLSSSALVPAGAPREAVVRELFGSAAVAELVALPPVRSSTTATGRCPSCSAVCGDPVCPFCHVRLTSRGDRP